MSFFVIRLGNSELGWIELTDSFSVGRNPLCDLVLHDALLSRRHFQIEKIADQWFVQDMDSKNGTWRNDQPLSREPLNPGDLIVAGRYTFQFHHQQPQEIKKFSPRASTRPADPTQALQGTIHGMVYAPENPEIHEDSPLPRRRPRPIPRPYPCVGLLEEDKPAPKPPAKLPIMLELPDEYDLMPTGEMVRRPASPLPAAPTPQKNRRKWNLRLNLDLAAFLLILVLLAAGLYVIQTYIPIWR